MAIKTRKPVHKPPMLTIVGSAGTGKSTMAGLTPNSVFIQCENAETVFESWDADVQPDFMPKIRRSNYSNPNNVVSAKAQILAQIRDLATEEHDFKNLNIDTVTSLNSLFEHEVCQMYNVDNVGDAAGGFFKGYKVVASMHAEVKNACDYLQTKRGMSVQFLAHTGTERMKNSPDCDEYSFYTLDMYKDSIPVYTNLVDGVYYLKKEGFVKDLEKTKKGQITKYGKMIQTGDRTLVTTGDGKIGYINAKSRYPLDAEIPVPHGENPLLTMIPYFVKLTTKTETEQ